MGEWGECVKGMFDFIIVCSILFYYCFTVSSTEGLCTLPRDVPRFLIVGAKNRRD